MTSKPMFVTDELVHYETALIELFHTDIPVPPTGKRGRPRKPLKVIDPDLMYAKVKKMRKGKKVVKVEWKIRAGDGTKIAKMLEKSRSNTINTSYIEGRILIEILGCPFNPLYILKFKKILK
jgi:hypothetical protein